MRWCVRWCVLRSNVGEWRNAQNRQDQHEEQNICGCSMHIGGAADGVGSRSAAATAAATAAVGAGCEAVVSGDGV